MSSNWVLAFGSSGNEEWDVVVERGDGWHHTGLYAGSIVAGATRGLSTGDSELVVVPLSGSLDLACTTADGVVSRVGLTGRASVFDAASDVAYVPRGSDLELSSAAGCRVALTVAFLPSQPDREAPPFRHLAARDVPVELRGAGQASREVRNFATPAVLDAEALIACEVVTPAGNWSSYPPHKHDEAVPGAETELEEIYYHEVRVEGGGDVDGADPFGYLQVYGTPERPIDVLTQVRSGDVVLVPHGWHGPAMAPPGYDLYYLNVMAGPGPERAWLISDDPAHAWVRETWSTQSVDPRLPLEGPA